MTQPFKKYLPKSLFGRVLLIIVLPVAIMQIVVAYIFFNAHWATVTATLSDSMAANVSMAVELYKEEPSAEKASELNELMKPMALSVALREDKHFLTAQRRSLFSILDKTLQNSLSNNLDDPFWFDTTRYSNFIDIRVKVDEGTLTFIAARERVFARTGFVFIFWLVLASLLLTLVSILFIRNQARPISRLAAAADAFGKGQDIADFKPSGAAEVRLAGQSFLKMRRRISRFMEQRTRMLAGVSHDLRTPLTRLNLHLAMQDDNDETRAARADVKDMENMLNGYLDFARGQVDEESSEVELIAFIESVAAKTGVDKDSLNFNGDRTVRIKPGAMTRALTNIISNSQKYGNSITLTSRFTETSVSLTIDDDGPGIPEENYSDVFKPFHRLDTARNQNIDGTGLGLSIARDIIRNHGGKIKLGPSSLGGLKVSIELPV